MNWLSIAMTALSLVPSVVADVETIITGAKQGAAKKSLALASINAATGIADEVLTGVNKAAADGISALVSRTIDAFVAVGNTTGLFKKTEVAAV